MTDDKSNSTVFGLELGAVEQATLGAES